MYRPANALRALEGARMVDLSTLPNWRFLTPKVNVLEVDLASSQAEEEEGLGLGPRKFEEGNKSSKLGSEFSSDDDGAPTRAQSLESDTQGGVSHTSMGTRDDNAQPRHHRYTDGGTNTISSTLASATSSRTRRSGNKTRLRKRRRRSQFAAYSQAAEQLGSYRQSFAVNATGRCGVAAFVCWWFELDLLGKWQLKHIIA